MLVANINFKNLNDSSTLYAGQFERAITKEFKNHGSCNIDKVILDFRGLDYIDVVTLPNISSFVQSFLGIDKTKHDSQKEIGIRLPDNKQVLMFLKLWDFADSFYHSTKCKRKLADCLEKEGENDDNIALFLSEANDYSAVEEYPDESREDKNVNQLINGLIASYNPYKELDKATAYQNYNKPKNFFGVYSFDLRKSQDQQSASLEENRNIVLQERKRWDREGKIKAVLDNVLKDKNGKSCEGYIPNRIIWECISNALRHPDGDLIQTASRFINKKNLRHYNTNHFTLVFWDNGQSMIDTLRDAYHDTSKIKALLPPRIIHPIFEVDTDEYSSIRVNTRILPGEFKTFENEHDYYWFLATFFPGVTKDPEQKTREGYKNQNIEDVPMFKYPGMGLYLLLKTVVDNFGGTINVRTSNYKLKITASTNAEFNYKADIKKVESFKNTFRGNLLSIHLPLHNENPIPVIIEESPPLPA